MSKRKAVRDPERELHEHRHDPEEWSDRAVSIEVRPAQSAVVSCRMPAEEFEALEAAARAAGESISEYVREAIAARLHGGASGDLLETSHSVIRVYINDPDPDMDVRDLQEITPPARVLGAG